MISFLPLLQFPVPDFLMTGFAEKLISDPWLPWAAVVFLVLLLLRIFFRPITQKMYGNRLNPELQDSPGNQYDAEVLSANVATGRKVVTFFLIAVPVFYLGYVYVHGTPMQGHTMQWLNLVVRWIHVVVGIMWIGASFYFIFLENNLNRTKGVRDELAGNLWAIHGGGFYFLEKYKVAPEKIPGDLHWFKYEAYLTWISGFVLLWIVYYMNPGSFLIDRSVADISAATAISIGVGTLVAGWFVYDFMCKSPLVKKPWLFSLTGLVLLTGLSIFLVNVFSSRAAFIHVGAVMGTMMAANVFFIIIPSQKALVRAAIAGEELDPTLGTKAQERSLHNNYLTLPVIFTMISHHFPSTFAHDYNWAVLMGIVIASAGIKHYWNLVERGSQPKYILPLSVAGLLAVALVTSPMADRSPDREIDFDEPADFSEVNMVIQNRCATCHSAYPSDQIWTTAPGGIKFDTPEEIRDQADEIMRTTVHTDAMPLGNLTDMTQEERDLIHRWVVQGKEIDE